MTLIIAIRTKESEGEGILISSDSQATMGPITYRIQKIFPIVLEKGPLALAAGAGDTALIKKAVDLSNEILLQKSLKEWNEKTPSFDQFKETISEIEASLIEMFSAYRQKELEIEFDFLLGNVDLDGVASLYLFDGRGVAQPVHDDPGFASIGSGFYLGGDLILQQFYSPNLDWLGALELTTYAIDQVSKVDRGVGPFEGDSFYLFNKNGNPFLNELHSRGIQKVKFTSEWKKKLLKYVWEQSDLFGAKELNKIIKQTIKETKKKQLRARRR
jgi:20S proteasome alpha/beta subunit